MKPNDQQKQWLKEYLQAVLTYRETYEEVYDHLLVALNNSAADQFFETSVVEIIENYFGGSNGLMDLENNCKKIASRECENNYRRYFLSAFKTPYALYFIAISLTFFFILINLKPINSIILFIVFLFIPIILLAIRGFKIGRKFGDTKTSLEDSIFARIAYRHILAFYLFGVFISIIQKVMQFIQHTSFSMHGAAPLLLTAMLTLISIHIFSVYRSYKKEFKVNITQ